MHQRRKDREGAHRLVGDDVLADGKAHAGAGTEGGGEGPPDHTAASHDPAGRTAESACHLRFFLFRSTSFHQFIYPSGRSS